MMRMTISNMLGDRIVVGMVFARLLLHLQVQVVVEGASLTDCATSVVCCGLRQVTGSNVCRPETVDQLRQSYEHARQTVAAEGGILYNIIYCRVLKFILNQFFYFKYKF